MRMIDGHAKKKYLQENGDSVAKLRSMNKPSTLLLYSQAEETLNIIKCKMPSCHQGEKTTKLSRLKPSVINTRVTIIPTFIR